MSNSFVKAEKVVQTSLALLAREVAVPQLLWRNAVTGFEGAKDDTISVRLPAYVEANSRALRSGDARTKSSLKQRKVDVTLDTDLYIDAPVTDEEMELDVQSFATDIAAPIMSGIARGIENKAVSTIEDATYNTSIEIDPADLKGTIAEAREALNKANVPGNGRTLLIGTEFDSALVTTDWLSKVNESGTDSALRDALIGRLYGFNVVVSNAIAPDTAYAFHSTAFPFVTRVPRVPSGVPWGTSMASNGFGMRLVQVFDPDAVETRVVADSWVGVGVTTDVGAFDESGRFTPAEDPEDSGVSALLTRAVELTAPTSGF